MILLRKGEGWGVALLVRLPCGHEHELLREQVAPDGRVMDRVGCTVHACRRVFEGLVLEGWDHAAR